MGHVRQALAATASIVLGLCGVVASAADVAGVGVIAGYRPAAARYTLVRPPTGEKVPVRIGALVAAGDRLSLPAGASVAVQLANDATTNLQGPGEFVIPAARPLGKLAVLFRSLPGLFDEEYRLDGTAASRGGEGCGHDGTAVPPIAVPLLVPGASLVAGTRDLPLAWRGGCAPFDVRVLAGRVTLARRDAIDGSRVRLDGVSFAPGRYTITITDVAHRRFEGTLEAVAAAPAIPVDLASDTSRLGVVAQAVWLAQQDQGRWKLESFDRLRPLIRAGDPLAGAIGDGVLWGTTPR
jgi:hypothetical protein